ncbi:hypothetical protein ACS0TY_012602 [Phlomoides rotata]
MEVKEKREIPITPVILKFGLAVAISLGGVVYTYLRLKKINPPKPKSKCSKGCNEYQVDSRIESCEVRDDDLAFQKSCVKKVSAQNSNTDQSSNGDRESYLLPEFNDLEKECSMSFSMEKFGPRKSGFDVEYGCCEDDEHEQEVRKLRNMVSILQEKERNLELQLLEYYGIKEQETAVMELQNQLKLNTMEAKLYNLKIESLMLDNRRLEAQVADYANANAELEASKGKIKMLKKKLKFEMERNRDQILKLQDRVMNIQEHERKAAEILQERELLKSKLEEMRICNQVLKQENYDLVQKIDYVKMLAPSALDEEVLQLREQYEESRKKMERLQDERCRDLEELVYLRWINACLRYELRNYGDGSRSVARDLGKNLSPKLEDEAKKLILEYGNIEVPADKYMYSDQWSPTTDEREDPLTENKTSKKKLFAKLRRLIRGKSSTSQRTNSVDNIPGRLSCEFPSDVMKASRNLSRRSFDIPRSYSRGGNNSSSRDDPSNLIGRIESIIDYNSNWDFQHDQDNQDASKEDLLKFAEALKNCQTKSRRRSISYEFRQL